jgi:hypothetical protein
MTFHMAGNGGNCAGCDWIVAEGEIKENTPDVFTQFLADNSHDYPNYGGLVVHLNSNGGNLLAALKLGEIIRIHSLNTMVAKTIGYLNDDGQSVDESNLSQKEGICASACVFSFIGGVTRWAVSTDQIVVDKRGRLGVHQFTSDESFSRLDIGQLKTILSASQVINGVLVEYLDRMGVSTELLAIAAKSTPNELHWLTDDELKGTRIETGEPSFLVTLKPKDNVAIVEVNFSNLRRERNCRHVLQQAETTFNSF